jgi:hypothetical protein
MKITIRVSSIIRSVEYLIVICGSAILLASMFRYLMMLRTLIAWPSLVAVLIAIPIALATHHYLRVFVEEPGNLRFWKSLGLAVLGFVATFLLAFVAYAYMFSPINFGPGP